MSITVAQPVLKKQARKVQFINKISTTYYKVVGDTGNAYYYDAWTDCCNCLAGQHGMDCYHAKSVRDQIEYSALNKAEYLVGVPTADIGGMIRDLGLTAQFKGLVTIGSLWGKQEAMLIDIYHKDYFLCEIHCINSVFIIQSHLTGRSKMYCPKDSDLLESLKENLTKLRNYSEALDRKAAEREAKESLIITGE